ncbi:hypothetical protein PSAB6_170091 [Paraburkholderia sabiae]|nr:hypothetical protein PSAB6_170091 [Paraburkholderia sabiae]
MLRSFQCKRMSPFMANASASTQTVVKRLHGKHLVIHWLFDNIATPMLLSGSSATQSNHETL